MGDKTAARKLAEECGVPTVPGTASALLEPGEALEFARSAGFPVILKAAMGGGGRGMRVVCKGVPLGRAVWAHSSHIISVSAWFAPGVVHETMCTCYQD